MGQGKRDEKDSFHFLWGIVWAFFFLCNWDSKQAIIAVEFLFVCTFKTVESHLKRQFQACFDNFPLGMRLKARIL